MAFKGVVVVIIVW